jgi:hypothetical protein
MKRSWTCLLFSGALLALQPAAALAQTSAQAPRPEAAPVRPAPDGAHDFDFEFGSWKAHISRRLRPLTGSNEWVEYEGTSVVHPLWDGRANVGELKVGGPAGSITGMSLRLYDPEARQWKISWANSSDGALGPPMVGGFENGRGEFYNQETLGGRAIFVRFIFSGITAKSFSIEQAFSADGGKSWETNWISRFTR